MLVNKPKVIFATLGRLLEVFDKDYVSFEKMKMCVIDEADKFKMYADKRDTSNHTNKIVSWNDLTQVFDQLPKDQCRIAAFSATYTNNTLHSLQKQLGQGTVYLTATTQDECEKKSACCDELDQRTSNIVPRNIDVFNLKVENSGTSLLK